MIINKELWKVIISDYYINNYFCKVVYIDCNINQLLINYFCETINNDKN